jgi:hypothetical protein
MRSLKKNLPDVIWTKEQVADYLHYKVRTLERVGNLPHFPAPARPGKPKVWRAIDIIVWVRTNASAGAAVRSRRRAARAR